MSDDIKRLRELFAAMPTLPGEDWRVIDEIAARTPAILDELEKLRGIIGAGERIEIDGTTDLVEAYRERGEELERVRRDYLALADALLPSSAGPADLVSEARRLRRMGPAQEGPGPMTEVQTCPTCGVLMSHRERGSDVVTCANCVGPTSRELERAAWIRDGMERAATICDGVVTKFIEDCKAHQTSIGWTGQEAARLIRAAAKDVG